MPVYRMGCRKKERVVEVFCITTYGMEKGKHTPQQTSHSAAVVILGILLSVLRVLLLLLVLLVVVVLHGGDQEEGRRGLHGAPMPSSVSRAAEASPPPYIPHPACRWRVWTTQATRDPRVCRELPGPCTTSNADGSREMRGKARMARQG